MANDTTKTPLLDQIAVIAGGMGGIGYATARRLANAGARIVLLDRGPPDEASDQAAQLPGSGHGAIRASIDDSEALRASAKIVEQRWQRVDILVNAAGFTKSIPHGDLDALDDALIDSLFVAHWRGPFATIRAFAPLLRANGNGLVINLSSIAATTGMGSNVAYCAAKAAIDSLAVTLGRALAPAIRVVNVAPGVVDTQFVPGRDEAFNARTAAATPLKRIGTADDIAAAIEACATTLRFSTGTVIQVDGGRHL